MKNTLSILILFITDILMIFISLSIAFLLRQNIISYVDIRFEASYEMYIFNFLFYFVVLLGFFFVRIYRYRYDFWEETLLIYKSLILSFVLLLAVLALTKTISEYSRLTLSLAFGLMFVLIPLSKNILKKYLFKNGLWKREAEIFGDGTLIQSELFKNPYLGYVHSDHTDAKTIFLDTNGITADELKERLDDSLKEKKEVLFIPLLQSYNLSNARIIELTNARKNLIVFENSLLKKRNIFTKKASDLIMLVLLFPFLILIFTVIIILIKREEPKKKIFFKQTRMGYKGEKFLCYKFRTMHIDGDDILKSYLKQHPEEITYYSKYHKYKNDPRMTNIGRILRKTSLDELPQVFNVLKGEMSFIGPRPYMLNEKEKMGDSIDIVLSTRPGITGLWQVSGRSNVSFDTRVEMDVWYTRNWNLWLDLVVFAKTIKVLLLRDGAH